MAPWLVVWFVVGIVSTAAVLACLVGLVRHVLVLLRTVRQLRDELQPIADELAQEGRRAGTHASALGGRRGSASGAAG